MKKFLSLALATLFATSALADSKSESKIDTLVVTTKPVMHCANCEKKIKTNIRFVKGTKNIVTSVPNQTVTIIFDGSKSTYQDFETAFKKIGYEIKMTKANTQK